MKKKNPLYIIDNWDPRISGGAWDSYNFYVPIAFRYRDDPSHRGYNYGFRICRTTRGEKKKKKNPLSIQDISFRTKRGGSSYDLSWHVPIKHHMNRSRVYPSYRNYPLGFRICRTTRGEK